MSPRPWIAASTFGAASIVAAVLIARAGYGDVPRTGSLTVHPAAAHDVSPPLASIRAGVTPLTPLVCEHGCGDSDPDADEETSSTASPSQTALGGSIEQKAPGARPAAKLVAGFDGLGVGFTGVADTPRSPGDTSRAYGRNPSDNSLAVGPAHIVQIVNSRIAVFTKTGTVVYGAVPTNTIFKGFGGQCENRNNGDAVVRYDQLAGRWLIVMPIFNRPPGEPAGPYSMCYAVSASADPLGEYYRYEFKRPLFPDYPRPAVWPDGYYVPTSTGDTVIQKHACVADRARMLTGQAATEQCVIIEGVNFLNNADIDGPGLPPEGAPNIMLAAGGSQLKNHFEDDGIYAWKFHVDWKTPANTKVTGPVKIPVALYHYLCDGQLTNCVPQPGTDRRLDAQGDKIMQRLVYRNVNGHESIVAVHSVNTEAGAGGVRWYEFRLDQNRDPQLFQQSTYAPDRFYRWMASPAMDRRGNLGIGYSFGGTPNFAGQRFAARLADDPPGTLSLQEAVLVNGEAAQTATLRWEDYAQTAVDPADDCTIWYVGDYLKKGAENYSSRIGAFRLPGCLRASVSGAAFFDLNHNGIFEADEPALPGRLIAYTGGTLTTGANGDFSVSLPADPAYGDPTYRFMLQSPVGTPTRQPPPVLLHDRETLTGVNLGSVCVVQNTGGRDVAFWSKDKRALKKLDPTWRTLVDSTLYLTSADGTRFTVPDLGGSSSGAFEKWLSNTASPVSAQLIITALNIAAGSQDGRVTVHDPVRDDWPRISVLVERISALLATHSAAPEPYAAVLASLNNNTAMITPSTPAACPQP